MFNYPNIAEHFYYLYWDTARADIVFGSYDLDETKRFIEYHDIRYYYIYDVVEKRKVELN